MSYPDRKTRHPCPEIPSERSPHYHAAARHSIPVKRSKGLTSRSTTVILPDRPSSWKPDGPCSRYSGSTPSVVGRCWRSVRECSGSVVDQTRQKTLIPAHDVSRSQTGLDVASLMSSEPEALTPHWICQHSCEQYPLGSPSVKSFLT